MWTIVYYVSLPRLQWKIKLWSYKCIPEKGMYTFQGGGLFIKVEIRKLLLTVFVYLCQQAKQVKLYLDIYTVWSHCHYLVARDSECFINMEFSQHLTAYSSPGMQQMLQCQRTHTLWNTPALQPFLKGRDHVPSLCCLCVSHKSHCLVSVSVSHAQA